jgi:ribonuclease Z
MINSMKEMTRWHRENFNAGPIGDGYEFEVTEFDWTERNGICYDQDGVTVRHWPRSHVKDGASAYRLDWEEAGLSFVWTGDGRPDVLSAEYGRGADVFVSEGTIDTPFLSGLKVGAPAELWEYTIDIYHTLYYASGYLFNQVQPRMAIINHYESGGPALHAESVAEVRAHWDGLFQFGGPDVQVINVTKDAIWSREAAIPRTRRQHQWILGGSYRQVRKCPKQSLCRRQGFRVRTSKSSGFAILRSIPISTPRRTYVAS